MTKEVRPKGEELTIPEVRNAALCLIAADAALCDGMTPEGAVEYARGFERALDKEPWAAGKHSGDCTKEIHSCIRCQVEEAEQEARERFDA